MRERECWRVCIDPVKSICALDAEYVMSFLGLFESVCLRMCGSAYIYNHPPSTHIS